MFSRILARDDGIESHWGPDNFTKRREMRQDRACIRQISRCPVTSPSAHPGYLTSQQCACTSIPPAVTGCGIGLAGVLGRACHSVASSAPSSCHSVGSSGDNLLANCGFDCFCATRWRRVYRHRATRWRRVARHRDHGDLGYLCRAAAPLAVIEWRDRYVPRTPLRRSMASRISCRVTTRKTVKSRSAQDLPDGLRYYVT